MPGAQEAGWCGRSCMGSFGEKQRAWVWQGVPLTVPLALASQHPLPFDSPTVVPYTAQTSVRLTLLPANHMPGSAMFLVEGERGAVLHTGDMRAEPHFVQTLLARSHLCRLSLPHSQSPPISPAQQQRQMLERASESIETPADVVCPPRLCNIYLDTERLLDGGTPLTKSEAILDVVQLVKLLPRSARVHIDCWTSGYEEVLLSLAKAFSVPQAGKIHLDRYKMGLFGIMAREPEWRGLEELGSTSRDECGRFCACDDESCVQASDVRIEADESMDAAAWTTKRDQLLAAMGRARRGLGQWPRLIPLPLQRHSPLCEIFSMIKLLKPVRITANTAHCPARFILGQISRCLQLEGAEEEEERQRTLLGPRGRADNDEWERCCVVWDARAKLGGGENYNDSDKAFFQRIHSFSVHLRGREEPVLGRVARERMDAADGLPDSVAVVQETLAVAGPWSDPGRYAAAVSSPFSTPAMRQAAQGRDGLPPPKASNCSPAAGAVLTVELASRYLAYASMFLGWKIRNPSCYRPEMAWRAIRKMRPDLAQQSESALLCELGLAIPPWDTASTLDLPRTPVLRASGSRVAAPGTPVGQRKSLPESISPLQLSGAALLQRLDEEAASQHLDGENMHGCESDVELVRVCGAHTGDEQRDKVPATADAAAFAALELMLRETRKGRDWGNGAPVGQQVFHMIVGEWRQPDALIDMQRFSTQLNLVGVAVRSRRARALLGWEKVSFHDAHRALKAVYSRAAPPLLPPRRGRAVLRYLCEQVKGVHGRRSVS